MNNSFSNISHNVGRHLFVLDKYFKLFLKYNLKPYDITSSECMILLVISEKTANTNTGISQEEINEELDYDKGVLTRLMKSLEEKDFIKREPNPHDGRSYLFIPTPKIQDTRVAIMETLKKWREMVFANITMEEVNTFAKNLEFMSEKAREATIKIKSDLKK